MWITGTSVGFLFSNVTPQTDGATNDIDTNDDDSSSGGSGPSDLEQQEASPATDSNSNNNPMMKAPTGGNGIAFNKGLSTATGSGNAATGAGTGMTGGAQIIGGQKIKQQINMEGITKDVLDEHKAKIEEVLAKILQVDKGAVQITSVEESGSAAQETPSQQRRRRLLASDASVIQYVVVVTDNQPAVMRQMLDTTSLAIALAPKLTNAIEGLTIDANQIKVQQPIAAKTKDADEDVSDGDLREAPRLDGNLDGQW